MRDVGMNGQPSSNKVAPHLRVARAQPEPDEADEARYRVTDQAVDALAVAWYVMPMDDVAIVCDHET